MLLLTMRKGKPWKPLRKGLELTRDEQWERINIILLIFAIALLLNATLILVYTLRMSNINPSLKRRFYFQQEVKGLFGKTS